MANDCEPEQMRLPKELLWEYQCCVEKDKRVKTMQALNTSNMQLITVKSQLSEAKAQIEMYKKSEIKRQNSELQNEATKELADVKKRMAEFAGLDNPEDLHLDEWTGLLYTFDDDGNERPLTVEKPKPRRPRGRRKAGTKK